MSSAPLACAERRISHRHLQGTSAQPTESDPRGAGAGKNFAFQADNAAQVWFTPILRALPLSPSTACPVPAALGISGCGRSTPHPHRLCKVGIEGITAASGEGCQN